jgi:hypothetical protein
MVEVTPDMVNLAASRVGETIRAAGMFRIGADDDPGALDPTRSGAYVAAKAALDAANFVDGTRRRRNRGLPRTALLVASGRNLYAVEFRYGRRLAVRRVAGPWPLRQIRLLGRGAHSGKYLLSLAEGDAPLGLEPLSAGCDELIREATSHSEGS